MAVKAELEALVMLQARELELRRIGRALDELEAARAELRQRVDAAEAAVGAAEEELQRSQREQRRLEMELKAAEEKLRRYKDQLLEVKTNRELWALQEEIGHAEKEVDAIEERTIEELERADRLGEEIVARRQELERTRRQAEEGRAEADRREQELLEERQRAEEAIPELRRRLPPEVLTTYERVKEVRGGVAVAEARDGTCLACHFRLRPQLYVDVRNLERVLQCENCNRILFVRDRLDLPESLSLELAV